MGVAQLSTFLACPNLWVRSPALHKLGMKEQALDPSPWGGGGGEIKSSS